MWKSLVNAVRKLPVAKWIKPWWKAGLKYGVAEGGDQLQKEVNLLLASKAEKALPEIQAKVDELQARFNKIVDALPFPAELEEKAKAAVNEPVDRLQERMDHGCAQGCVKSAQAAFDGAFDRFQTELAERIDAL